MKVAIGSAFRNSAARGQLHRYFQQVEHLHQLLQKRGDSLHVIAIEGDSVDNTHFELRRYSEYLMLAMQVVNRTHGCREWGSTEEPERMQKLSYVGNGILEHVHEDDDALIYVESDLVWQAPAIVRVLDKLKEGVDVIAPMTFAGEAFYDIWAFRKNGHRFGPFHPYHGDLNLNELTTVDSAGSCLIMKGEVARKCRIIDGEALVGFSRDVWAKGFTLFCDPTERIQHP